MGNSRAEEARERRNKAVLVIVPNDPESHVVVRLAEDTMATVTLPDNGHGTTLDDYKGVLERIRKVRDCTEVWTFELPGPQTAEGLIVRAGYTLRIIDHHAYGFNQATGMPIMDRTRDLDGNLRPSALAQFITLGGYTDKEIQRLVGHNPKTVHGIGIYDASVGWGLRAAGYSPVEIMEVLDLRARIMRKTTKDFDGVMERARKAWRNRERNGWYFLMIAGGNVASGIVQAAVEDATMNGHEEDALPIVLSSQDELVTTVRHVSTKTIVHLNERIRGKTFVFGTCNCWGVDNRHPGHPFVSREEVLAALETAPR